MTTPKDSRHAAGEKVASLHISDADFTRVLGMDDAGRLELEKSAPCLCAAFDLAMSRYEDDYHRMTVLLDTLYPLARRYYKSERDTYADGLPYTEVQGRSMKADRRRNELTDFLLALACWDGDPDFLARFARFEALMRPHYAAIYAANEKNEKEAGR